MDPLIGRHIYRKVDNLMEDRTKDQCPPHGKTKIETRFMTELSRYTKNLTYYSTCFISKCIQQFSQCGFQALHALHRTLFHSSYQGVIPLSPCTRRLQSVPLGPSWRIMTAPPADTLHPFPPYEALPHNSHMFVGRTQPMMTHHVLDNSTLKCYT